MDPVHPELLDIGLGYAREIGEEADIEPRDPLRRALAARCPATDAESKTAERTLATFA